MRALMWFGIGFAAACALGVYCLPEGMLTLWAVGMMAGFLLFLFAGSLLRKLRIPAAVLLGCSIGLGWFSAFDSLCLEKARLLEGEKVSMELIATDFSRETDYGASVDGVVKADGAYYKLRLYLKEDPGLCPGDRLCGEFRVVYSAPRENERISYNQGRGVFLTARAGADVQITGAQQREWWHFPAFLGRWLRRTLEASFPEDVYPFVKALLLGDASDLSYEQDTALKTSGIRHVIAVSGLHVSILYTLVSAITFRRRFLTALIGLPVLAVFAAVAGFTPSVTRACVMAALMMIAQLFQREYDSPTALSFACIVMLTANPLTIGSVSFQLSVGCVAGILLFQPGLRSWLGKRLGCEKKNAPKWKQRLAASVAVSLSAMALTTPLSMAYFDTVSLVSPLTNLLTLWAVGLVFNGVVLTCIVSLASPVLASALGWLLAWPIRYVLAIARLLSGLPLAAVYGASVYISIWLFLCYLLLAVFFLGRRKGPALFGCCAVLGLCLALALSWAEPLTRECRVTVLDVGQGQCVLLQARGKSFLVDCGGDSDTRAADLAARELLSQGVRQLDGIILTHKDADHSGGVPFLLTRLDADFLMLPAAAGDYRPPDTPAQVIWVDRLTEISFDNCTIRIFPPRFSVKSNEKSLCILFETENCAILITGDRSGMGERLLLAEYALPKVDVLIAGHHGAADSVSRELLEAVEPETVIISAGRGNFYGHPAPETLARLEEFGCQVYRTDLQGTIIYRR